MFEQLGRIFASPSRAELGAAPTSPHCTHIAPLAPKPQTLNPKP